MPVNIPLDIADGNQKSGKLTSWGEGSWNLPLFPAGFSSNFWTQKIAASTPSPMGAATATQRQGKDCWENSPNRENSLGKVSSCLGFVFQKKNGAKTPNVEVGVSKN